MSDSTVDKRHEARNSCFLRADIIVGAHIDPIPAEAHDISERGLRLQTADAAQLPDEFIVSIPRRNMREIVRVTRRETDEVGVVIKAARACPP